MATRRFEICGGLGQCPVFDPSANGREAGATVLGDFSKGQHPIPVLGQLKRHCWYSDHCWLTVWMHEHFAVAIDEKREDLL